MLLALLGRRLFDGFELFVFLGQIVQRGLPPLARRFHLLLYVKIVGAEDHCRGAVLVGVGNLSPKRSVLGITRALEYAVRIGLLRFVAQDHDGFVLDVHLVIVVVIFVLTRDAVAHEHERQVKLSRPANGQWVKVLPELQFDAARPLALFGRRPDQHQPVRLSKRGAGGQGKRLKRSAVGDVGRQTDVAKLCGDEVGRQIEPLGAHAAALQLVGGQVLDVIRKPAFDRACILGAGRLGAQRNQPGHNDDQRGAVRSQSKRVDQ